VDSLTAERLKSLLIANMPPLIYALIILLIGFAIAKLARRWLRLALNRTRIREDSLLKEFFLRTLSVLILTVAALSALSKLGFDVTSFVAGLGVTGLIIGFALKDTLSNFASGMLLLIYRPFRAGELVEVEGALGVVEELTIVNMRMRTDEGVSVILPNSKVWGSRITNYSVADRRRVELTVKLPLNAALKAVQVVRAAIMKDVRVLREPQSDVRISSIGLDDAVLTIWLWVPAAEYASVTNNAYEQVLTSLRQANLHGQAE
jgi:small conductance mechanosensitive channel